jgi:hypothetical protein
MLVFLILYIFLTAKAKTVHLSKLPNYLPAELKNPLNKKLAMIKKMSATPMTAKVAFEKTFGARVVDCSSGVGVRSLPLFA